MNIFQWVKERYHWKGYFISSIIVSMGLFVIYSKSVKRFDFGEYFALIPLAWLLVLIFMVFISEMIVRRT